MVQPPRYYLVPRGPPRRITRDYSPTQAASAWQGFPSAVPWFELGSFFSLSPTESTELRKHLLAGGQRRAGLPTQGPSTEGACKTHTCSEPWQARLLVRDSAKVVVVCFVILYLGGSIACSSCCGTTKKEGRGGTVRRAI